MWQFAESLRKKINKRMWAWQAWQWATPPHPSVNKQCSCVVRQFYAGGKISACCLVGSASLWTATWTGLSVIIGFGF